MEVSPIEIIAGWLKRYRKMYPEKTQRKHVHEFVRVSKLYFEELIKSDSSDALHREGEENKKLLNWETEWLPLVSSFYLTYTIW